MSEENMSTDVQDQAAQEVAEEKPVSTFRLVATLGVAGMLAGLLLVLVNQHTKPMIDAYKAEQLRSAVYEVLPGTDRYDTYYLVNDALSLNLPEGAKESEYKRIYVAYNTENQLHGVAMSRGESGFQDVIMVIFGWSPKTGKLMGMKVLDSKETPGLGDKIFKDLPWVAQFFNSPDTPLVPIKPGTGKGLPGEIDTITGATISTKKVIEIINNGLEEWQPYIQGGLPQSSPVKVDEVPAEAEVQS